MSMSQKLEIQFEDLEQQRSTDTLGMWTFLATEILFFGGLFLAYTAYRVSYPEAFSDASRETNVVFGTLNTAILLTSSLTMAIAVDSVKRGERFARWLVATGVLGAGFLVVKALEYREDFEKHLLPGSADFPIQGAHSAGARMFYELYWIMTGLHAVHLTIGICLVFALAWRARARSNWGNASTVEVTGLYWHFVDSVWIFLYPLLYLIDRHS